MSGRGGRGGARLCTLFAYGTLQPHAATPAARWLARRLVASRPASVPGRLYAIPDRDGWYPAALPARSAARIRGTVCLVRLTRADRLWLDRYEGRDYRRVTCRVPAVGEEGAGAGTGTGARRGRATIYLWRAPLPPGARPLRGGSFLDWLRDNRCKAYGPRRRAGPTRSVSQ